MMKIIYAIKNISLLFEYIIIYLIIEYLSTAFSLAFLLPFQAGEAFMKKANVCGRQIKLARVKMDMDQIELAAALSVDHGLEITQAAISHIERGERRVSDFELIALAKTLDVSTSWLLFGDKAEKR